MMKPLVVVAGPTAAGKSAAGVELALRLGGSVISADSMQVYRHMDIGTAKMTPEEMRGVPHALIDIIDPEEEWNVGRFQQEAQRAVGEICARGELPILVGGTGFYIQALLYDIDFTRTEEDSAFRAGMAQMAAAEGPEALHARLQVVDPKAAQAIHPNNVKRVIRALEYARDTGRTISAHNAEQRERPPAYDAVFFCLTMDRQRLYERIDRRVDQMMEEGLVDEVRSLRDRGLSASDVSMQGLGYRQILSYLDDDCSLKEAVTQIKTQTRHFAKRQLTWFRREKDVIWMQADAYETPELLADEMEARVRNHFKQADFAGRT